MSNPDPKPWLELYREALFELDKTKIPERIGLAEQAIAARARSLFTQPQNASVERNALDAACQALSILKFYKLRPENISGSVSEPCIRREFAVTERDGQSTFGIGKGSS